MKSSIALKLGLLVATVALGMTALIGWRTHATARQTLLAHELVDLSDDTTVRAFELQSQMINLRKEARDLARTPAVQAVLGVAPTPRDRDVAEKEARRVLDPNGSHTLRSVCLLGRERVVACFGPDPGSRPGGELPAYNESLLAARDLPVLLLPAEAVREKRGEPSRLLVRSAAAVRATDGKLLGFVVVTADFGQLCENMAREMPRHLVFITDDQGRFLLHPLRNRRLGEAAQTTLRDDDDLTTAIRQVIARGEKLIPGGPSRIYNVQNLGTDREQRLRHDGLRFHLAEQSLAPFGGDADRIKRLQPVLERLAREHPGLRFERLSPAPERLKISGPDADRLEAIRAEIDRVQRDELGVKPASWSKPLTCETLRLSFAKLQLLSDVERLPSETTRQLESLNVVLAASEEEMVLDVDAGLASIWLWIVLLSGAAAGIAWLFARLFIRPLQQITRATEAFAGGQPDLPLPTRRRDEIGVLARSFDGMRAQVETNRARLKAIVDTATEGILTLDEHGRIESYNPAAQLLFGYRSEEVIGKRVTELIDSTAGTPIAARGQPITWTEDSVRLLEKLQGISSVEVVGRRKDGTSFIMEVSSSDPHPLGGRALITVVVHDITEQKQLTEQLQRTNRELQQERDRLDERVRRKTAEVVQQNADLEEANARLTLAVQEAEAAGEAKSAFLAGMTHEVRTPMNGILGSAQLMRRHIDAARWQLALGDPAAMEKLRRSLETDLEAILFGGRHLLGLIDDILDLARMQADRFEFDLAEFDLDAFLDDLQAFVNPLAEKNRNRLSVQRSPRPLGRMKTDERRLRQVLLNLLGNACKFTSDGHVSLTVERRPGGPIAFTIEDTGIGMTPETRARLFRPFEQGDRSIAVRYGGTGLGLVISRKLAELLRGSVELVRSEPGEGSTFEAILPAAIETIEDPEVIRKRERLETVLKSSRLKGERETGERGA